jgi:DNA-binding CsgD family transcriptional regulator
VKSRFESAAWIAAIARLVGNEDAVASANALADAIGIMVEHEGTCLLAFHRDAPPEVLHHTLGPAGRRHYVDRYLAGPYLLDPLYQLALREEKPGSCRFRDESPDRFRSSEYYRQYCERTHLRDEMDFLVDVSGRSTLVLVIGRRTRTFSKAELGRLRQVEAIVHAAMRNIWQRWSAIPASSGRDANVHRRLTRCFENFGEGLLTDREREITQLLLRGHSTKSVARALRIAPGTVMVHKRNLFAKLGITSQFELFSRFIDAL